ncbi:MAG: glycosyltransferase [Flavobacteriales bacterium TMED123]|jgi:N-acetylglucosaminyldiphosphoundecaprenol N-acetyl-beta-D-mannosaminyltransferase|nr:MAG: glycosyltransferase [Flavobacteriales bacterium TMED123]|tara:strand:- start:8600 stop:9337 length:738 start_codon:yes stop_codon:yes gene_type:complete
MGKINVLNIPIDAITMQETLQKVETAIATKKQIHHTVVNAGKVVLMQTDKELEKSVVEADIINADGQAVVWAANLLGKHLPERVSGIDLMEKLVKISFEKGYKCFFLGAKEEVVKKVVDIYREQYSEQIIAGYRNGYFNKREEEKIAKKIADSGANILFVAITSPKKEIFLNTYKEQLRNVNFIMGVGGSFDVIAGKVKRAPVWMQNIGFEWFYRFLQEPRRMWKRYLIGNAKFICLVVSSIFKK